MLVFNITSFVITLRKRKQLWTKIDESDYISSETVESIEKTLYLIVAVITIQTLCWVPAFLNRLFQGFSVYSVYLEFAQIVKKLFFFFFNNFFFFLVLRTFGRCFECLFLLLSDCK